MSEDTEEDNPNIHYRESLTIWGDTLSAQVRSLGDIALAHLDEAPRYSEAGEAS